jgi:hypothetical protein
MVLVIFGILTASVLLRLVVFRYGLLPVTMEAVLKKAVAIQVLYQTDVGQKQLWIGDRAQVDQLLSVLHTMQYAPGSHAYGRASGRALMNVNFIMPDGSQRSLYGMAPDVDPAFFYVLSEIVSRHEGCRIDLASDAYK